MMYSRTIMADVTCCVADQHCEAAANFHPQGKPGRLPKCFKCGQDVCKMCSSRRKYQDYGIRRLCNNCQVEEDGHRLYVLRRIYHQAGYPQVTLGSLTMNEDYNYA